MQHRQREGGLYRLKIYLITFFCLRHAQYLIFEHVLLFLNIFILAMFNVLREPVLDCEREAMFDDPGTAMFDYNAAGNKNKYAICIHYF